MLGWALAEILYLLIPQVRALCKSCNIYLFSFKYNNACIQYMKILNCGVKLGIVVTGLDIVFRVPFLYSYKNIVKYYKTKVQ